MGRQLCTMAVISTVAVGRGLEDPGQELANKRPRVLGRAPLPTPLISIAVCSSIWQQRNNIRADGWWRPFGRWERSGVEGCPLWYFSQLSVTPQDGSADPRRFLFARERVTKAGDELRSRTVWRVGLMVGVGTSRSGHRWAAPRFGVREDVTWRQKH